jgi:EAL domain-containing protein (putative c-di-GMP-specific phosphodiesterase class I)/CheY-like chemotaxis protein
MGGTMTTKRKILVIDDEVDVGEFVVDAAQAMGLDCTSTTNAKSFLESLKPDVDLILLDLMMPEVDGIELLRMLKKRKCKAGLILISGSGKRIIESAEQLAHALGLTIAGRLQKPFRLAELEQVLERKAESKALPATRLDRTFIPNREELRKAIDLDEFVLHYHPLIDIATGSVIGVEALVRWQHPELGLIFPDNFIRSMERYALIDELGWIVANRGMSEVGQFANGDGKPLMLSFNASVDSLHDLKFPDVLVSLAEKHGVSPADITVEITESGLIKELSDTLDILTRLRIKKVKLSIDDFGTGYAMMQQVRDIPATELKIDKSFVMEMHNNERDRIVVQKTIEMGHELGMNVVAEGVETREQLNFLHLKGCDSAQGYFFSRPLPANEMVTWLHEYRGKLEPVATH